MFATTSYPREIELKDIRVGDKIEVTTVGGTVIQDWVVFMDTTIKGGQHIQFRGGLIVCAVTVVGQASPYTYRLLSRPTTYMQGDTISGESVFDLPMGSIVRRRSAKDVPANCWVVAKHEDASVQVHRVDNHIFRHLNLLGDYVIKYLARYEDE